MAFSLLVVVFALILLIPVLLLSRPKASGTAKAFALGLSVLPIWMGNGANDDFAYMQGAWLVPFISFLPLVGVLINLGRSASKVDGVR